MSSYFFFNASEVFVEMEVKGFKLLNWKLEIGNMVLNYLLNTWSDKTSSVWTMMFGYAP